MTSKSIEVIKSYAEEQKEVLIIRLCKEMFHPIENIVRSAVKSNFRLLFLVKAQWNVLWPLTKWLIGILTG